MCDRLSRSKLGKQCEVLLVRIKYEKDLIRLLNKMSHLQCKEEISFLTNSISNSISDVVIAYREKKI